MDVASGIARVGRFALDFALPPRCAACGCVVDQIHSFCSDCWKKVEFLGDHGCSSCGLPLEGTDSEICAVCLAQPPRIARMRAAVAYDEITREVALRLKYGRKVALAGTMARYMSPLIGTCDGALLAPVPLHRSRLWNRGFNQSALVARQLGKLAGLPTDARLIERTKWTPVLKGLSPNQRRRAVSGAFRVRSESDLSGRTVILVDDVVTSGSTANACAKALLKAGASKVELVSWARVVRPGRLER